MSVSEIRNVVLLFSNPIWSGTSTDPSTIIRNITALASNLAYHSRIDSNITTLSTTNADPRDGVIQGLLYVPGLDEDAACDAQQYNFIPQNVTRRSHLPPTNYNLIALAPWFSIDCTIAYLSSARLDPVRAFIFYVPDNSTDQPQDADSPVWNLDDGGDWMSINKYPIFAVSGLQGYQMMQQLSLYSGDIDRIPHGDAIDSRFGPNPKDYVRIWSELSYSDSDRLPDLWVFVLIVIGALILVIVSVSCTMHLVQRSRRNALERRVASGEVDLEAMGIKRLVVPISHVQTFPVFTYNAEPESLNMPPTPTSRASRTSRRSEPQSLPVVGSIRSKRSKLRGIEDTTATNDQPTCHICLVDFEHRVTVIRELPCGHIYHPECIDEFLGKISSLCPMCKHSMLPRGYSPPITNGMVRRERALRRLRERVDLDEFSDQSADGDSKIKSWGRRLFQPSLRQMPTPEHTVVIKAKERNEQAPGRTSNPESESQPSSHGSEAGTSSNPAHGLSSENESRDTAATISIPPATRKPKAKKSWPFPLGLLPTQPEDTELPTKSLHVGRKSPSSFARQRMREIAAKNAPFDDPDQQRVLWRRGVAKLFPGYM